MSEVWTATDQAYADFVSEIACEVSANEDDVYAVLGAVEERGLFSRSAAANLMLSDEPFQALAGLFGLLQMISHRDDITPELRAILVDGAAENHRITTARAALSQAQPQPSE
jgi:hypothetical protein